MARRKKDNLKDMRLDREMAAKAHKLIWDAFVWSETREGSDYWYRVAMRLKAFAEARAEGVKAAAEQVRSEAEPAA